jgi:hypothetical protein
MAVKALDAKADVYFVWELDGLLRRCLGQVETVRSSPQDNDQEESDSDQYQRVFEKLGYLLTHYALLVLELGYDYRGTFLGTGRAHIANRQ